MNWMFGIAALFSFNCCSYFISGATSQQQQCNLGTIDAVRVATELRRKIFNDPSRATPYNRLVSPTFGFNTSVIVNLFPLRLLAVDDAAGRVRVDLLIHFSWRDPRLEWSNFTITTPHLLDPSIECDGIKVFQGDSNGDATSSSTTGLGISPSEIWLPPFEIAESTEKGGGGQQDLLTKYVQFMSLGARGDVFLAARFAGELVCRMPLRNYPFDRNVCNATVVSPLARLDIERVAASTNGQEQKSEPQNATNMLEYFRAYVYELKIFGSEMSTSTWVLNPYEEELAMTLSEPLKRETSTGSVLTYRFVIYREPWPHIWTWLVPPLILSHASVFGMYLLCSVGERFSFGPATVISLSVLISGFNARLSPGKEGLPVLMWLYMGVFFDVILATGCTRMPCKIAEWLSSRKDSAAAAAKMLEKGGEAVDVAKATKKRRRFELLAKLGDKLTRYFSDEQCLRYLFALFFLAVQWIFIASAALVWRQRCW